MLIDIDADRAPSRAAEILAGLGFEPVTAAVLALVANTAPVAFGSIGIPVTTLAAVTGLPVLPLSAMVGRLCALISVFIPGYLPHNETRTSNEMEILEVSVPGELGTKPCEAPAAFKN